MQELIPAFVNALNVFGIVLCLAVALLSRSIYHARARNPLLILSGIVGVLGIVLFSLVLYIRPMPAGEFPSAFIGILIWGFIIVTLMFLLVALVVNRWFPDRWRGRR